MDDRFDGLCNGHAGSVDYQMLSVPWIILTFKHALPCWQLVAGDIGSSALDSLTMRRCVGTDHLNLDDPRTCRERHIDGAGAALNAGANVMYLLPAVPLHCLAGADHLSCPRNSAG